MDKKRRVLIADDENVNREFFDIMLGNLGFIVDKAEDGEAVFELIRKNKPDIIIIDDMLPVITGWQITRTLKTDEEYSRFSDIPIIMLSEMADPEAVVEGFNLGVDDYIRKPFSFAVVYARIKAALRNRETMYKRAQHEEAVAVIKSLSNTFIFLSDHLKTPVGNLKSAISDFSNIECIDKNTFVNLIAENTNRIMAALESLSAQITEIKKAENEISDHSLDLSDLEEKYRDIRSKMKAAGGR
ncbi:MAG: response regulator [Spirochaetales bacterium]|nr:response regulator [Spirochaetales bacterium]